MVVLEISMVEPKSTSHLLTDDDLDVVLKIARNRAALMMRLKEALVKGDDAASLALAREACGLEPKEVTHA
jgi:hypothetical protein